MTALLIDRADVSATALQGRVAIVTGAGRGIGRETARALARLGASVVIAEINDTGRDTESVIAADGGRALFVQTDVSDADSMEHLKRATREAFGEPDIIINNAVVFQARPLLDLTLEEWDRTFAVNLRGAFLALKLFMPAMLKRRSGVFVTMESAEGMPYLAPYLATKVGLRSLAQSLAQEVGEDSGVSVYCFGPGIVETPALLEAIEKLGPLYGMSRDEFIASSGMELASAELCATGLVGTILQASQFHGQETAYGAGLVLLGLDAAAEASEQQPGAAVATASQDGGAQHGATLSSGVGLRERLLDAAQRNSRVEEMLQVNIREYDELTIFQRPIMRRMFQSGTGMRVEEWLEHARGMRSMLEKASETESAPDPKRMNAYIGQLRRLATFVTKQESDARGFIRDPEKLKAALEALRERRATVDALADAVEGLLCFLP